MYPQSVMLSSAPPTTLNHLQSPPALPPMHILAPSLPNSSANQPMQLAPLPPPIPLPLHQHPPIDPYQSHGTPVYVNLVPITQRLLQLTTNTGYDLIQENGQRHFGPPPGWEGPPPPRGSEIFIGKLPINCFEDEIVPVFEQVGPIYELRLMMNFTGYNRGFAFITYFNPNDAWKAVVMLNHYELRPGHKIGVSKSIDNCRLYIGGIPLDKTKEDAWNEIGKTVMGINDIILYPSKEDRQKNRGFMFVEFQSHRLAAMAKRKLVPGNNTIWDQKVTIDWADPEPDVNPCILASVTKLFVRNSSENFTDSTIRDILSQIVPGKSVLRIYINHDYGFIHFDSRASAEIAKSKLEGVLIDKYPLEVQWARPRNFGKNYNHNAEGQLNYYRCRRVS